MVTHHRDQDLFGKLKKLTIKTTQHHSRVFSEIYNCCFQIIVCAPARSGNRAGGSIEQLSYLLFAFCRSSDYMCGTQGLQIAGRILDFEIAGIKYAVPAGLLACPD